MITAASRRRAVVALALVALVLGSCSDDDPDAGAPATDVDRPAADEVTPIQVPGQPATGVRTSSGLALEARSTFPEYVTGGDVVIRVGLPDGVEGGARLTVEGRDVTGALAPDGAGGLEGLVTGLPAGSSELVVQLGDERLALEVTDHPVTGPLFSGLHQEPFSCAVQVLDLGEPLDDDCSAEPVRSTRVLDGPDGPVPIGVERGTINRGVYELHWPTEDWNGRLVHRFGGGCGTSHNQGLDVAAAFDEDLLAEGYALAASTLTAFRTACNDVLSAETVLMVTERFAELVGPPELVIGEGASGGAIQQLLIAQNYPGLLDGVAPSLPFPDIATVLPGVADCGLLLAWFDGGGSALTEDQRAAITGFATSRTCAAWAQILLPVLDPTEGCAVAARLIYDPETNPDGTRCTLWDANVNLWGIDPDTGVARRPLDNVGVQYGLAALLDGTIDVEGFVALNEGIGGYDLDGAIVGERHEADPDALERAYARGRVLSGRGLGASATPILATTPYLDDQGDIHDRFRIFSVRARMQDAGVDPTLLAVSSWPGDDAAIASLTADAGDPVLRAVVAVDRLLTRAADGERVAIDDTCNLPDGTVASSADPSVGPCASAYPPHGDPRLAAGAPLADDVLKCVTEPPQRSDYPGVRFTADQWDRLVAAFPDGVCDWTRPGVGQVALDGTWRSYADAGS